MSKSNHSFKIMVLGEAGVGKSSLLRRYKQGTFSSRTTTTVGVDRIPLKICVDHEELQFQVLDTSGSFGFRGLIKSYMTNIDAVVLMYDISNKESFASLPLWTTLLKAPGNQNMTKVLVGNKRDLATTRRQVKFKNAKNYAEFEGMISMEISVKEEESVDLVFQCIARELRLKKQIIDSAGISDVGRRGTVSCVERNPFQSTTKTTNDFIETDDSGATNNSKQFVRKFSLMITRSKINRKQLQEQHRKKDSSPSITAYSGIFSAEKDVEEKRYLMW